jgi:hypothetical protein
MQLLQSNYASALLLLVNAIIRDEIHSIAAVWQLMTCWLICFGIMLIPDTFHFVVTVDSCREMTE